MKKKTKRLVAEVGAGVVTAAALAGAATYFLSNTKMAKKGKAQARTWVKKAQAEVIRNVSAARKMSQADYMRFAESAARHYGKLHDASAAEMVTAAREMKAEWKNIRRHAENIAKNAEKSAQKVAKRPTKKRKSK